MMKFRKFASYIAVASILATLVACSGEETTSGEGMGDKQAGEAPTSSSNAELRQNIQLGGAGGGAGADAKQITEE